MEIRNAQVGRNIDLFTRIYDIIAHYETLKIETSLAMINQTSVNDTRIEGEAKGFVRKYVPRIRFDARRKTVEISNFEYIDTLS